MKQSENNTPASPPVPESLLFDKINAEVPDARPMRRGTPATRASQRVNKAQSVWGVPSKAPCGRTPGRIRRGERDGGVVGMGRPVRKAYRFHRAAPWRRVSSSVCKAAAGIQQNLLNIKHQAPAGLLFFFSFFLHFPFYRATGSGCPCLHAGSVGLEGRLQQSTLSFLWFFFFFWGGEGGCWVGNWPFLLLLESIVCLCPQ